MTFRKIVIVVRDTFIEQIEKGVKLLAEYLGYPENPGMYQSPPKAFYWKKYFVDDLMLPKHPYKFPPITTGSNFLEIIFGSIPKADPVPRFYFNNLQDGYFAFYVPNYSNSYFLPDFVSALLQVRWKFCEDLSSIEIFRETLLFVLVVYTWIIHMRVALNWYISFNPHGFPLAYFTGLTDWFEQALADYLPSLNGLPIAYTLLGTLTGRFADIVNHLVFTMPYLPSEGKKTYAVVKGELIPVVKFTALPSLWSKYPIPNNIREYWYTKRPDILKYLLKVYKDENIQFLPDRIISQSQVLLNSNIISDIGIIYNIHLHHSSELKVIINSLIYYSTIIEI